MNGLTPELLLMASMGFMGSLHCIGMCGGLVTAVTMSQPGVRHAGLLIYQGGRITSYALLGLIVGVSGSALGAVGGDSAQRAFALLAGALIIIFALNLAGWLPDPLRRFSAWAGDKTGLARLARRAAERASGGSWFALGLANGLLPCGLVYAGLSLALAADSAAAAATMMIAFGIGTVPAMMLVPSLLHRLTPARRHAAMRTAAMLMTALGLLTIYRGVIVMQHPG